MLKPPLPPPPIDNPPINLLDKCYQILLDIPKSMRSLHLLLVFLKQPQTYLLAKQDYGYLLAAKFLSIAKTTYAHLGTSALYVLIVL